VQELGKLLVLLHRNTSPGSLAALMKQFDLNQNNKLDFSEFVLLMQSLPEADEALLESAVNAQPEGRNQAASVQQIELHPALASIGTQVQLTCISARDGTVIAGAQTGQVFIWDLEASIEVFQYYMWYSLERHCCSFQEDILSHVGDIGPVSQTHVTFVSRAQFVSGASDGTRQHHSFIIFL
jgi:hypothetical protein